MRRRSALAATGLLALSCSGPGQTSKPPAPTLTARHLVLVTIDTLRADRLGCYGSTTVETPHLDRIAREGAMALQASAPVPLTLPSHASLMTGRLPPEHGQRDNLAPPLPLSLPTLAEILKGAGFETAAFISSVVLAARTRLDRGFETYADDFEWKGEARFLNTIQRPGDQTLGLAVEWLEQRDPARRFFAWIHLYDPHEPYEPPEPFASRYAGRPYDGEVAWSDELIGRLYAALERLSLLQHTLLVVVSDHGEGLGDHEETLHGFFVYQTTLRVPLIVRGPGVAAGGRVEAVVQIPDLFPTILDLMGVAGVPEASGRNIAPALRGGEPLEEEPIYAESLVPRLHFGWSELRMLREGRFKFIEAPRPELYDLVADPGETRNIIDQQASRAQAMREALGREIDRLESRAPEVAGDESVPSEVRQQLGALGYLGGASSGSAPGADPKDKIEEFVYANDLIREAIIHFQEGDARGAAQRFEELLTRGIEGFEIHYYLGQALVQLSRFEQALAHLEAAQELQPRAAEVYEWLADCHAALGDTTGALRVLRQGRAAVPGDAVLPRQEARLFQELGWLDEAVQALEAARTLRPEDARLRVQIGELHRDRNDLTAAAREIREAVRLDPAPAASWNSLGSVLGAAEEWDDALSAFREAIRRDERNHRYIFNLGLVLLRSGETAEATRQFRRALELKPDFQAARDRLGELGSDGAG